MKKLLKYFREEEVAVAEQVAVTIHAEQRAMVVVDVAVNSDFEN